MPWSACSQVGFTSQSFFFQPGWFLQHQDFPREFSFPPAASGCFVLCAVSDNGSVCSCAADDKGTVPLSRAHLCRKLQVALKGGHHRTSCLWYSLELRGISFSQLLFQSWSGLGCGCRAGFLPLFEFLQKCSGGILSICQSLEVSIYGSTKKNKNGKEFKENRGGGSFCLSTHSLICVFNNTFSMHQNTSNKVTKMNPDFSVPLR